MRDYRTQLKEKDDLLKQKCDLLDQVSKHEESMARELAAKDAEIEHLIKSRESWVEVMPNNSQSDRKRELVLRYLRVEEYLAREKGRPVALNEEEQFRPGRSTTG